MSAETSTGLLGSLRDRGDERAWDGFVGLYAPLLRQWLRSMVPACDADDLVQEVLLAAVRERRSGWSTCTRPVWSIAT
jgi:DNA-directed RNA polymerase specialized sigma24 family protein